jgi:hypothetical protein
MPDRRGRALDLVPLRDLVQHQAGGERSDNHRGPESLRQPREQKRERQPEETQRVGGSNALEGPEDRRSDESTRDHRDGHEGNCHPRDFADGHYRQRLARHERRDHREDDQSDDVVDHRRPKNDPSLVGL